jgi:hypothetical protein
MLTKIKSNQISNSIINVMDYIGTFVPNTDYYTQILAALTAAGGKSTVFFPYVGADYKFGTNLTVPSGVDLVFEPGASLSPVASQTITYTVLFGQPSTGVYVSNINAASTVSATTVASVAQFGHASLITCGAGAWPVTRAAEYFSAQTGGGGTEQAIALNTMVQQNAADASARLCGIETDVNNNKAAALSPDDGSYSESTAKYGNLVISGGSYGPTAAYAVENFNPGTARYFWVGQWFKDRCIAPGGQVIRYDGNATNEAFYVSDKGWIGIGVNPPTSQLHIVATNANGLVNLNSNANSNFPIQQMTHAFATGAQTATMVNFKRADGTVEGSITTTITGTAYNTSSDYRLKNITGPITESGKFIDLLMPKQGTWKSGGGKFVGFIAHEVAEVSPSSVIGEKDSVDENGTPLYQSMEYGSAEFIANIVAELQSLRLRVAELEAKTGNLATNA